MKKLYILVSILFAFACRDYSSNPVSPGLEQTNTNSVTIAGKGASSGEFTVDATATDFFCTKASLVSTCSGSTSYNGLPAVFGGCLPVTPTGSSYSLSDDAEIYPKQLKNGQQIQTVQYYAQDVPGAAAIQHRTDAVVVSVPVAPNSSGFVIHVHADNIPVWKLSGHTGGKKVEVIGRICIGDLVYTPSN